MPSLLSSLLGGPASQEKQPRPGPFDDFWYEVTHVATRIALPLANAEATAP